MQWKYNEIYTGNSDDILIKMLNDGLKFDLILTDPPYNLKKDFGNNSDNLTLPDFIEVNKKRIHICKDLLKKEGSIILN